MVLPVGPQPRLGLTNIEPGVVLVNLKHPVAAPYGITIPPVLTHSHLGRVLVTGWRRLRHCCAKWSRHGPPKWEKIFQPTKYCATGLAWSEILQALPANG